MEYMSRYNSSTWLKLHALKSSDEDIDSLYADVLSQLVGIRLEKGLTQTELAKRSGLTSSMISKIEAQHTVPSIRTYMKYVRGLGLDWVLVEKNEKENRN